jgi:hypothetical protein
MTYELGSASRRDRGPSRCHRARGLASDALRYAPQEEPALAQVSRLYEVSALARSSLDLVLHESEALRGMRMSSFPTSGTASRSDVSSQNL